MEQENYSKTVVFTLNYEGEDYRVQVEDIEMANLLLNDSCAAAQYMRAMLDGASKPENRNIELGSSSESMELSTETETWTETSTETLAETKKSETSQNIIWTKKKPTAIDDEATSLLLLLRKKMKNFFEDKKTRQCQIWKNIAKEMEQKGFHVGKEDSWLRCRQKFANLQKAYLNYIKNQKTTGSGSLEEPPFFEQIHSIIGDKHKVVPAQLEDSLGHLEVPDESNSEVAGTSSEAQSANTPETRSVPAGTSSETQSVNKPETRSVPVTTNSRAHLDINKKEYSDRFKKGNRKLFPSRHDGLMKQIEEDRKARKEEFNFYREHLNKSQEQRDRLLGFLEQVVRFEQPRHKHKRQEFSDSD